MVSIAQMVSCDNMTRRTFPNNCYPPKSLPHQQENISEIENSMPILQLRKRSSLWSNLEGKRTGKVNAIRVDLEDEVLAQEGIGLRREARRPRHSRPRRCRGRLHGAAAVLGFPPFVFSLSVDSMEKEEEAEKKGSNRNYD
jgi:hypothetical protein